MKNATLLRLLFLLILIPAGYYTLYIQTEKYQSHATVMIKDLSKDQSVSTLTSMLLPDSSSVMKDSRLIELYIRSADIYKILDKDFNLSNYYTSNILDPVQRLYSESNIPYIRASGENIISRYRHDISTLYDTPSSTLKIAFSHADANTSRKVVQKIISICSNTLNRFEQENAQVVMLFLKKQAEKNKELFAASVKKLIAYQNQHQTIDPKIDIEAKSTILASLESELIKKEIEYKSQSTRKKRNAPEMKVLQSNINHIRKNITTIKNKISGNSKNDELNSEVYDFQLLQSELDFNKELYKNTLAKLEETKVSVSKSSKNLIVVSSPTLPDEYISPNKPSQLLSIFLILLFLYGILRLIIIIIKDHKD